MKYKNFVQIAVLLCFLLSAVADTYSQQTMVCGTTDGVPTQNYPVYPLTDTDVLRALIIYVRFQDDNFWCCDPGWPVDRWTVPDWYDRILTPEGQPITDHPSLTGFYDAMSQQGWQLRGEEYPYLYITQHTKSWYNANGASLGIVSQEVIQNLDANINFANYDKYDPRDIDSDQNIREPDGEVDMLILWYRWICASDVENSPYSGVAALGGAACECFPNGIFTTNDIIYVNGVPTNVTINPGRMRSGLLAEGTSPYSVNIFAHEVGHFIYGAVHFQFTGLWNMMNGNGVGIMSDFERSSPGVNWTSGSTVINSTDTYNLSDFESTGEAFKLYTQGETYTIENRGTIGFYSAKGNWIMPANGMLITINYYQDIACADHKWIWQNYGSANCTDCANTYGLKFKFPYETDYPSNSGQSEMQMRNGICAYNGSSNLCGVWHDSCYGDAGDIWDIGYNQVFSYWSNPQAALAPNGQPIVVDLLSRNVNGSLDILIKYGESNAYVGTHPSKPMYLRCTQDNFDPNDIYKFHPKLTWFRNTEPDMSSNAFYKIFRADMTDNGQYTEIATISAPGSGTEVTYIDESFTLWDPGTPGEGVCRRWKNLMYKVQAIDNEELYSVYSDPDKIEGFQDPCSVVEGDNFISGNIPKNYSIYNYPNPFNPTTDIKFSLPKDEIVTIKVYNLLGEEVTTLVNNAYKTAGNYSVKFNGSNLASGVYFYTIEAGTYMAAKKMVLIK